MARRPRGIMDPHLVGELLAPSPEHQIVLARPRADGQGRYENASPPALIRRSAMAHEAGLRRDARSSAQAQARSSSSTSAARRPSSVPRSTTAWTSKPSHGVAWVINHRVPQGDDGGVF